MAAVASVNLSLSVSGLTSQTINSSIAFNATTPDAVAHTYKKIAVSDTEEAVELGDVSVVQGVLIHCVAAGDSTAGIYIDTDFDTTFNASQSLTEGKSAYFKPAGVLMVKNITTVQRPTYEVIVFGTR